jgi:two-component system nitrogen regulation response regulator NtrX
MSGHLLLVDDEQGIRQSLSAVLQDEGYRILAVATGEECLRALEKDRFQLVLLDVWLKGIDGLDVLRRIHEEHPETVVVMISGHGTVETAVRATKMGAFDFLEKPLSIEKTLVAVKNALEHQVLLEENRELRDQVATRYRIIGESVPLKALRQQLALMAPTNGRVLIYGESGAGKELVAHALHAQSLRSKEPFVEVNCAAIPEELIESELFGHEKGAFTGATSARRGKFELADRGTLFLDEVGDLHAASQAKLLRVLQEGEFHRVGGEQAIRVSVRVIAATNRDLSEMVAQQKFREDLYYRLCVVPVRVPSLRERREDIGALAEYFLGEFCARNNFKPKRLSADVFAAFEDYGWPGNIRELRNTVERMAILTRGNEIDAESVPVEIRIARSAGAKGNLREARESAEREHILRALEESHWNVSGAARALGMERTNLHKRIRALGLSRGNR